MEGIMKRINLENFRGVYKTPLFWISFLFLLYTLVGFLLVPQIAKNKIVKTIDQKFGKKVQIENVSFNPFSFSFSFNKVVITDSIRGEIINSNEIYLSLNAIPLLKKHIDIEKLEINDSELSLEKEHEKFNFSKLFDFIDSSKQISNWAIFVNEFNSENLNISLKNKATESNGRIIFENINIHLGNILPQSNNPNKVELNITSLDEHKYKFMGSFSNMMLQVELSSLSDTLNTTTN